MTVRLAVILLALPPLLAAYAAGVVLTFDTSQTLPQYLLLVPLAYMLGAVPWGFLLIRLTQGEDIRESGSGGIGTSNVLRRAGTKVAAAVLVLDLSKGVLAVLLGRCHRRHRRRRGDGRPHGVGGPQLARIPEVQRRPRHSHRGRRPGVSLAP